MNQYNYQSQKFYELLKRLQQEPANGILYVSSQIDSNRVLSSILAWKNGEIVYGNSKILTAQEIAKQLLHKLNPKMAPSALKFVMSKTNASSSARKLLSLLTRVKALKWEQIEASIQTQVASLIEQISLYPGKARLDDSQNIELSFGPDEHGLDWSNLHQELKQRQEKWDTFAPEIPSPDAIPQTQSQKLVTIDKDSIREHIQKYVDGKRSLIEIANQLNKDPLNIARSYYSWVQSGWISFATNDPSNSQKEQLEVSSSKPNSSNSSNSSNSLNSSKSSQNLPIILSVDDSLIVQASIKRALQDDYKVLLSDNAVEALKILNNNKVDLLLLDVTMPDIDGLEMCKTLRKIPKFRQLPIVMVTARDTLIDKMKGQIAGTNHYLTKPFDNEKLREVINKYIGTNNQSQISA